MTPLRECSVGLAFSEESSLHVEPQGHPERQERLVAVRSGWERSAAGAKAAPLPNSDTHVDLNLVHEPSYVSALERALGTQADGYVDPDTYYSARTSAAVAAAARGSAALGEWLAGVDAGIGFALHRPPGHHATRTTAMGFCFVNNVALAARTFQRAFAVLHGRSARCAIVDWDVHHGNGTEDIFIDDDSVLTVSLHQTNHYPYSGAIQDIGAAKARGFNINLPFAAHADGAVYAEAFRRIVLPVVESFSPDAILVAAGFDAHELDPLGDMNLTASDFAAMATSLHRVARRAGHERIGYTLEGGYDLAALEDSTCAVANVAAGHEVELSTEAIKARYTSTLDKACAALRPYWPAIRS